MFIYDVIKYGFLFFLMTWILFTIALFIGEYISMKNDYLNKRN